MSEGTRRVVEFAVDADRCLRYAEAGAALEVLFASRDEPAATGFAWRHLPGGGRLRRWAALAHALGEPGARAWAAVHPRWDDMLFLAWLAGRRGAALEYWLGEEQTAAWVIFLALRAFGSEAEATHWQTGLACAT
jgi:hypothetical protein